jgi:hypothetical protein
LFIWNIYIYLQLAIYSLYYSQVNIQVDAGVHSEHGKVIKSNFKPGSVERSIDLYQGGYASAAAGDTCYFRHQ